MTWKFSPSDKNGQPTQKEMVLDLLEVAVRWGLIIGIGLQLWVWLSATLDVIVR